MIHVFIGTKAQYIKTAPVIRRLDSLRIPYNLIDSGQHAGLAQSLRTELAIRPPDVELRYGKDIASSGEALSWLLNGFLLGSLHPQKVIDEVFRGEKGICLIHGDTPTTLLSMFLAKRAGLAVAHLEAGLRSYNYLNPFPEELIRIMVMRAADLLFAPGEWAFRNLEKMRLRGRLFNLRANTNLDSLAYALRMERRPPFEIDNYCLVSFHRVENLYNRGRLRKIVDLVRRISEIKRVVLVLHPPTELQLKKTGLYALLRGSRDILLSTLLPHHDFVSILSRADFVVTDGGSVQEESFYLNVPCLLMRKKTERPEGLGLNVWLSEFDDSRIEYFLKNYPAFQAPVSAAGYSPSQEVVDYLLNFMPALRLGEGVGSGEENSSQSTSGGFDDQCFDGNRFPAKQ